MAETPEETPENTEESAETTAPETPETLVDEVQAAAAGDAPEAAPAEESAPAEEPAPAAPVATRRERLEARRAERHAKDVEGRGQRTIEERAAERAAERKRKAAQRTRYRARLKTKRAERRAAEPAQEAQHAPEHGPGRAKQREGIVVSDKADKTIIVRIDMTRRHRRYKKILRSSVTLHAHDESNNANAGDTVRIQECRPMSRTKRWRLVDVLERAK
jgi:small subunit ribosomal protein S17